MFVSTEELRQRRPDEPHDAVRGLVDVTRDVFRHPDRCQFRVVEILQHEDSKDHKELWAGLDDRNLYPIESPAVVSEIPRSNVVGTGYLSVGGGQKLARRPKRHPSQYPTTMRPAGMSADVFVLYGSKHHGEIGEQP